MERYFEWDRRKTESNFQKHGIRFEEAALVFDDPFAVSEPDRIDNGEQRWRTIGMIGGCWLVLVVAHTVRFEERGTEVIRVIQCSTCRSKRKGAL